MKAICAVLVASLAVCSTAFAIPISLFSDTDTHIKRAKDIVTAKCVSIPKQPMVYHNGLYPAEVEVLMILKGDKKRGPLRIATVYPMKPGETYLLSNSGGSAFDTDFLALSQLSVVPIPSGFDLGSFPIPG